MSIERCYICDEPTGRAGRGEDSLYCDECDSGPYCSECWDEHEADGHLRGSEVDRLKRIIREQDETVQRVLKERNEALGKLAVAQATMQRAIETLPRGAVGADLFAAVITTGTREARIVQAAEDLDQHYDPSSTATHGARSQDVAALCAAVRGEET